MKITYLTILTALLASSPAMAEKPEWAGKDKMKAEQQEVHESTKQAKQEAEKNTNQYEKNIPFIDSIKFPIMTNENA